MEKDESKNPETIELPTPTGWPIIAAFGLTLLFAGLVTNLAVSAVGLLTGLAGAIGWFRDVFPHPKHEPVEAVPPSERAAVKTSARSVQHLKLGEGGHRVRIPVEIHPYSAGIKGGLAGGAVMAVLACIYGWWVQGSIWYPVNLLAAAGVPSLAEASLETLCKFSALGFGVALVSHVTVSILVGLLYAVLLPMLPAKFEWLWGGIITPLIWSALLAPILHVINPALAARVDWFWFVICQVAFGMVGGFVVFKSAKIETMQTWPLAAKMGVEAKQAEEPK